MPSAGYEFTNLWKSTLALQRGGDPHKIQRQALNQAFLDLRDRAKPLAAEISRDLPEFTNHDISHLDALWSLADRIAGKGFHLTPTEGFVLGAAFLIHDLAMGLAAYPKRMEDLKKEVEWTDSVGGILKRRLGRSPTPEEIQYADRDTEDMAKSELLRELHARQAETIGLTKWESTNGEPFFLIDKPEIRLSFGGLICKLAASHHWSLTRVRDEFPGMGVIGAPASFPPDWTIDPIKLACLLRAADASHLDERRAPIFLQVLRQPTGVSKSHWIFQNKLLQPTVENNRLVFTANPPGFSYGEALAWWLCLDTLRMVDAELRDIDDLFVNLKKGYRFEARAVEGVNDLEDFAGRVPTSGWEPVDTRIHVTDVANVVRSLGGKSLYGDDYYIPLRELIQNGRDAILARRLLQTRPDDWGSITVRFGKDEHGSWGEVEDTGVGMSMRVMKGALLDFGVSFWNSPEMREEHPGLLGKAFEAVGKYGIGFFSVFMWGDRVQVTSRRYDAALDDTKVLTFDAGLASRPILRKGTKKEQLQDGGTRVRIWYNAESFRGWHSYEESADEWTRRLAWLCPSLDVDLHCHYHAEKARTSVKASDWITINGVELLKRLFEYESSADFIPIENAGSHMTCIHDEKGQIVGRAMVAPHFESRGESNPNSTTFGGVVTVGGMRASTIERIAGILKGQSSTASRTHALPVVPLSELKVWAASQAKEMFLAVPEPQLRREVATILAAIDGDISQFEVECGDRDMHSFSEISQSDTLPNEILVIDHTIYDLDRSKLKIPAFVIDTTFLPPLRGPGPHDVWPPLNPTLPDGRARLARTMAGVLIAAVARSWGVDMDGVLDASGFDPQDGRFKQGTRNAAFSWIGSWQRSQIGERVFLIRKPRK